MGNVKLTAGVVLSSTALALSLASPALAWHPQGKIVKKVQNVTASSALVDANTASMAVMAKPGDTLKYVIEVSNTGASHSENHNDMVNTKVTDTLPAGVSLVGSSARTVNYDLGRIKPGKTVTKEIMVKVTAEKDGSIIENTACFTGDSEVKDAPQKGCDNANVKVEVPVVPATPEKPVTPVTPAPEAPKAETPAPATPATLPSTGPETAVFGVLTSGILGYAAHMVLRRRG